MKHNNSNQSITGKKFVGPIKNPGGGAAVGGAVIQGSNLSVSGGANAGNVNNANSKKNYMSPYS